jgi:hypothetical protein
MVKPPIRTLEVVDLWSILWHGWLLARSLVHQSVWQSFLAASIPNLNTACSIFVSVPLVFYHTEELVELVLYACLNCEHCRKESFHMVFLCHSLTSHWLHKDILLQASLQLLKVFRLLCNYTLVTSFNTTFQPQTAIIGCLPCRNLSHCIKNFKIYFLKPSNYVIKCQ